MTLSTSITSPNLTNSRSPFSNSNTSLTSSSPTSPDGFITSATYKKPTTKHITQLSTSSPAGIAIANQVTPERLAKLLKITGPLAIRHITSNLSKQIQGFEKLSLSKQRRLIMGCLNKGDEQNSIIFEKIGWGQWSCKQVDPSEFTKERNLVRIANEKVKDSDQANNAQTEPKSATNTINDKLRRESITRSKYESDNHDKFLSSKQSASTIKASSTNEFAILSDDDDESSDFDDDDEELFKFEDEESIPPLKLNNQTPTTTRISPPITSNASSRRQSHSGSKISKVPIKSKRSNSQTPTSPELLYFGHGNNIPTSSRSRRHSSIRSTLNEAHVHASGNYTTNGTAIVSSSIPNILSPQIIPQRSVSKDSAMHDQSSVEEDTDEEDWESIGALRLLKSKVFNHSRDAVSSTQTNEANPPHLKSDEQDAAFALVNLRSI